MEHHTDRSSRSGDEKAPGGPPSVPTDDDDCDYMYSGPDSADELEGLVPPSDARGTASSSREETGTGGSHRFEFVHVGGGGDRSPRFCCCRGATILRSGASFLVGFVAAAALFRTASHSPIVGDGATPEADGGKSALRPAVLDGDGHRPMSYTCPDWHPLTDDPQGSEGLFEECYKSSLWDDPSGFRNATKFDGWNKDYATAKDLMTDWKVRMFGDNLRSGDSIYESACGVGLNLLMTLEILAEERGIHNLTVYGNEYIRKSARAAAKILEGESPEGTSLGSICAADSTNLSFVPPDSMDLVYTGYIDPLQDPLDLNGQDSDNSLSLKFCRNRDDEALYEALAHKEQRAQEDWFAAWLGEMLRIVKPGGVVIVEEVARPQCKSHGDYGGVEKVWWAEAVLTYGWDVEPRSVQTEASKKDGSRYNVIMRRNNR